MAVLPVAHAQGPAEGPDGSRSDVFVTIAARECSTYGEITANRARNNIQESLRDLGADTLYNAGEEITPAREDEGQPNCRPITGWSFTLGTGIRSKAVAGPWGALSIVTEPFGAPPIVTEASVPLRDDNGRPVPGETVAGAATIELTEEQALRTAKASSLWIQGGTPTDPILFENPAFTDQYGFGALRCAIDNLNGDNVEWIQLPVGARHVFCYAYYVRPPPTSGTIVVRKEVVDAPNAEEGFVFGGNLSYDPSGTFRLDVRGGRSAQQTFYRAAGSEPWVIDEQTPTGWALTDLRCSSGESGVEIDRGAGRASITLAASDTVTCTYVNTLRPPGGELAIRKVTQNGVGRFRYTIRPAGGGERIRRRARTRVEGIPVDAGSPAELGPGLYRIREDLPSDRSGTWRVVGVDCNGEDKPARKVVSVRVTSGEGVVCTFVNRFRPRGALEIEKVTRGGVGTTGFEISPVRDPETQLTQSAVTERAGEPARARGDDTSALPLGTYVIGETGTEPEIDARWVLEEVTCNGRAIPFQEGRVRVRLTRADPEVRCRFVNQLRGREIPIEPPGENPVPGGERPDVVVTKRASRTPLVVGSALSYTIDVTNRSSAIAAEDVVVDEQPGAGLRLLSISTTRGACQRTPLVCYIAALGPGQGATITVRARVERVGLILNTAVLGTGSPDSGLGDNRAVAAVRGYSRTPGPCLPRAAVSPPPRAAC